jgi:hypothetical protein
MAAPFSTADISSVLTFSAHNKNSQCSSHGKLLKFQE